jgi:GNAT superfamily N-acetyltransferase
VAGREDYGWVVERHRELYVRERGWDDRFVALVAAVVDDFERGWDPARERGWIAELDGRRVGSVFLVRHPGRVGVAKLRLLLVEPEARGLGIGGRLVAECTAFARAAGYRAITLWTSSVLDSARRLYEAEGYRLVREEAEELFLEGELGQEWELAL